MHPISRIGWLCACVLALTIVGFVLIGVDTNLPALQPTSLHAAPAVPSVQDWPQLGHDAQRTNYTAVQVDPPYCYTWKWYEAPIASRAQPVVSESRLFIGGMDGYLYARNASTGAPLWKFNANSPIRHSAGVLSDTVIFSTHAGVTYALGVTNGNFKWQRTTGASASAPLMDGNANRVYVAATDGKLTALNAATGAPVWQFDAGAAILTSPSLSADGQTVFIGNEAIEAIAVNATNGAQLWRVTLQGQSLMDRYPVVAGNSVIYRSQPLDYFHFLLSDYGDDVMDKAGVKDPNWTTDWNNVRPQIVMTLTANPRWQTFFALNPTNGISLGVAPMLYTYGNQDVAAMPVITNGTTAYVVYRARHGIQTDGGSVHVTTKYDAELGRMNLSGLDITGLTATQTFAREFRATSDEPSFLTMGGNILWADSWERLGGINVNTGALIHVGAVSNNWPECFVQCGPGTTNPFFPLSGSGADYPFPSPRVNEGHSRGGVVIANNMLYWRVIEGGLAGISHRAGASCPAPLVYTSTPRTPDESEIAMTASLAPIATTLTRTTYLPIIFNFAQRALTEYVTLDLTTPITNPPTDLRDRLRREVSATIQLGTISSGSVYTHLLPFYLERGFSYNHNYTDTNGQKQTQWGILWPYNSTKLPSDKLGYPIVQFNSRGNVYWDDPGELLYTLAMAYPYLDTSLQTQVKAYMAAEMARYPTLSDLPFGSGNGQPTWVKKGKARELYSVPFRSQMGNWPPPAVNIAALYGLWLWSKNTNDWSYATTQWNSGAITTFFNNRTNDPANNDYYDYYANLAGAIGYYRLAQHYGNATEMNAGLQAAINAMNARSFTTRRTFAENAYLDAREQATGWYVPVFYGLTPEVGLYLREQTSGQAQSYLAGKESGDGLRWWYMTRAGAHAEVGETSYVAPLAAWSHFLAHAYVVGETQATLRPWLDRPWTTGDLYSIQKIVATIHAP